MSEKTGKYWLEVETFFLGKFALIKKNTCLKTETVVMYFYKRNLFLSIKGNVTSMF